MRSFAHDLGAAEENIARFNAHTAKSFLSLSVVFGGAQQKIFAF
jgi:hypothetical protein